MRRTSSSFRKPNSLSKPLLGCHHGAEQLAAASGDIDRVQVRPADAAFVRQVGWDRMSLEQRAAWRETMDQGPRTAPLPAADRQHIAVLIQAHSLDASMRPAMIAAEGVQHDRMIER